MWNRLSTREKVLLAVLFGGGIVFCAVYFILVPQFKAYAQVKNELTENRANLSRAQATAASLKTENDRFNKVKEDYAVKGKPFTSSMRDGSDVIFLGLISASERVDITEIEPGDIIEKTHSLELPLKIGVQGNYLGLIEFCKDIDKQMKKSTNLAEIRSLNISSGLSSTSQSSNQSTGAKNTAVNVGAAPGTVKATIGIVMFSAKNPEGKLYLEEVSRWLLGRGNVFRPTFSIAPYAELSGTLSLRSTGTLPAGAQYTGSANTQLLNADPEYTLKK
jgi:type IV pilus assembly protein PilO